MLNGLPATLIVPLAPLVMLPRTVPVPESVWLADAPRVKPVKALASKVAVLLTEMEELGSAAGPEGERARAHHRGPCVGIGATEGQRPGADLGQAACAASAHSIGEDDVVPVGVKRRPAAGEKSRQTRNISGVGVEFHCKAPPLNVMVPGPTLFHPLAPRLFKALKLKTPASKYKPPENKLVMVLPIVKVLEPILVNDPVPLMPPVPEMV